MIAVICDSQVGVGFGKVRGEFHGGGEVLLGSDKITVTQRRKSLLELRPDRR